VVNNSRVQSSRPLASPAAAWPWAAQAKRETRAGIEQLNTPTAAVAVKAAAAAATAAEAQQQQQGYTQSSCEASTLLQGAGQPRLNDKPVLALSNPHIFSTAAAAAARLQKLKL
jgi:hypothetical protein